MCCLLTVNREHLASQRIPISSQWLRVRPGDKKNCYCHCFAILQGLRSVTTHDFTRHGPPNWLRRRKGCRVQQEKSSILKIAPRNIPVSLPFA
ncbi:hypothetical protein RB195_000173 [Necator americanus]|uniref:Uncharacterized protein n=1 Tax=Necator americanus TaxID=51031 RepID=A0ABR1D8B9_NECAM